MAGKLRNWLQFIKSSSRSDCSPSQPASGNASSFLQLRRSTTLSARSLPHPRGGRLLSPLHPCSRSVCSACRPAQMLCGNARSPVQFLRSCDQPRQSAAAEPVLWQSLQGVQLTPTNLRQRPWARAPAHKPSAASRRSTVYLRRSMVSKLLKPIQPSPGSVWSLVQPINDNTSRAFSCPSASGN